MGIIIPCSRISHGYHSLIFPFEIIFLDLLQIFFVQFPAGFSASNYPNCIVAVLSDASFGCVGNLAGQWLPVQYWARPEVAAVEANLRGRCTWSWMQNERQCNCTCQFDWTCEHCGPGKLSLNLYTPLHFPAMVVVSFAWCLCCGAAARIKLLLSAAVKFVVGCLGHILKVYLLPCNLVHAPFTYCIQHMEVEYVEHW